MCKINDKQKHNYLNEKFAIAFYRLIQTVRLHQDNNQLIKQCTAHFTEIMENILGDDKLNIFISKEQFYIQGEKLQQRKASIFIQDFLDFLIQRRIKGFVFHPAIKSASALEVLSFVRLLIGSVRAANPPDWLSSKIKEQVGPWVEILEGVGLEGDGGCFRPLKERALAAYFQAQSSLKEVAHKLSLHGNAGMLKAKRLIQNMADLIKEDEALFLGLSTIRDYDDYTYSHSVNVAVLSMCLGNRIGLSRSALSHLGMCGLFHDLGKVEVPAEIIKKPDKLNNKEWGEMSRHPLLSVRQILNLNTSHALKSKIILAPLEHHLNCDLSGYPQMKSKKGSVSSAGYFTLLITMMLLPPRAFTVPSLTVQIKLSD